MKKIFLLLLIFFYFINASEKSWIPHYLENTKLQKKYNEQLISIQTNDQKTTKVPTSLVQQIQTLKHLQEDLGNQDQIPVNQISALQLRSVLALMESVQDHSQLKGKKLYDAMSKDVYISNGIDVLKAVNYLDIKPPLDKPVIEFLTYEIAGEQDSPWWKPRKNTSLLDQLKDFGSDEKKYYGALIARYYLLRTGKYLANIPQDILNHKNYAFSIRDYVEYPAARMVLNARGGIQDRAIVFNGFDLSNLYLNSLDGFQELISFSKVNPQLILRIYLDNNKLETIEHSVFDIFPRLSYLVLSNNKLTSLDPLVFMQLPLKKITLNNNMLTQDTINQLKKVLRNVEIQLQRQSD